MDPLSGVASVIAVLQLTQEVVGFVRAARDSSDDRRNLLREASSFLGMLTTLHNFLQNDEENGETSWRSAVRLLEMPHGALDQCGSALATLAQKLKPGRSGPVHKIFWKITKEEVKGVLFQIERAKSLAQVALEMDHIKLTLALGRQVQDLGHSLSALSSHVTSVHAAAKTIEQSTTSLENVAQEREMREALAWLSNDNHSSRFQENMSEYLTGSGSWFLNDPAFQTWLNLSAGVLFCPGDPGTGKTMLATAVIDKLQQQSANEQALILYLFCDYKRRAEQTTTGLLRSLLRQIVSALGAVPEHIRALKALYQSRNTHPGAEEIGEHLVETLCNYPRVSVVVDALDELESHTRDPFLRHLHNVIAKGNSRLLVTSRSLPTIETQFAHGRRLEIRADGSDIEQYVRKRACKLSLRIRDTFGLVDMIVTTVTSAAAGMFLLARLNMDTIVNKTTPRAVKQVLDHLSGRSTTLPTESPYDQAYDDAMARVMSQPPEHSALAKAALSWVACAKRTLFLEELQHALATEVGDEDLDTDGIPDKDLIISVCSGLVTLVEHVWFNDPPGTFEVRLVHFTTQEYFERRRSDLFLSAQLDIAQRCLTYLAFDGLSSLPAPNNRDVEARLSRYEFGFYAATYSGAHANDVERVGSDDDIKGLAKVCSRLISQPLALDVAQHADEDPIYVPRASGLNVWHFIARWDLSRLFRVLCLGHDFENRAASGCGSPVFVAVASGSLATLTSFVASGYATNEPFHESGRTLLIEAVACKRPHIVRYLLENMAMDVNAKDKGGLTALSFAAWDGEIAILNLLVEAPGIDIDSRNSRGHTPLALAAWSGKTAAARRLLQCGTSVPSSPAGPASHSRCLDSGPDILAVDNYKHSILWLAALSGVQSCCKLILDAILRTEVPAQYIQKAYSQLMTEFATGVLIIREQYGSPDITAEQTKVRLGHAASLLELFAPATMLSQKTAPSGRRMRELSTMLLYTAGSIVCDVCDTDGVSRGFRCWGCVSPSERLEDFDVCASCVDEGRWCHDKSHRLQEFKGEPYSTKPDLPWKSYACRVQEEDDIDMLEP